MTSWFSELLSELSKPSWVAGVLETLVGAMIALAFAYWALRAQLAHDRELAAAQRRAEVAAELSDVIFTELRKFEVTHATFSMTENDACLARARATLGQEFSAAAEATRSLAHTVHAILWICLAEYQIHSTNRTWNFPLYALSEPLLSAEIPVSFEDVPEAAEDTDHHLGVEGASRYWVHQLEVAAGQLRSWDGHRPPLAPHRDKSELAQAPPPYGDQEAWRKWREEVGQGYRYEARFEGIRLITREDGSLDAIRVVNTDPYKGPQPDHDADGGHDEARLERGPRIRLKRRKDRGLDDEENKDRPPDHDTGGGHDTYVKLRKRVLATCP